MRSHRALAGLHFFEEPHQTHTTCDEQRRPAEYIHEGPKQRLLPELTVKQCLRSMNGVWRALLTPEDMSQAPALLLKPFLRSGDRISNLRLVQIGPSHQERLRQRDSDGTSDVPYEVKYTAGVPHLFIAQCAVSLRGNRHKDEAQGKPRNDDGPQERGWAYAQVHIAKDVRHDGEDCKSKSQEIASVHLAG